jgi:hypothetical protein
MPAEQYSGVHPGKTSTFCDVANLVPQFHFYHGFSTVKNGVVCMELQMLFHITRLCPRFTSGWNLVWYLSMHFPNCHICGVGAGYHAIYDQFYEGKALRRKLQKDWALLGEENFWNTDKDWALIFVKLI